MKQAPTMNSKGLTSACLKRTARSRLQNTRGEELTGLLEAIQASSPLQKDLERSPALETKNTNIERLLDARGRRKTGALPGNRSGEQAGLNIDLDGNTEVQPLVPCKALRENLDGATEPLPTLLGGASSSLIQWECGQGAVSAGFTRKQMTFSNNSGGMLKCCPRECLPRDSRGSESHL